MRHEYAYPILHSLLLLNFVCILHALFDLEIPIFCFALELFILLDKGHRASCITSNWYVDKLWRYVLLRGVIVNYTLC